MTYRTQENPYAQAVAAARQAVEIRDAARELDWQRGRAEAVAALRDFAEVITPALFRRLHVEWSAMGAATAIP